MKTGKVYKNNLNFVRLSEIKSSNLKKLSTQKVVDRPEVENNANSWCDNQYEKGFKDTINYCDDSKGNSLSKLECKFSPFIEAHHCRGTNFILDFSKIKTNQTQAIYMVKTLIFTTNQFC